MRVELIPLLKTPYQIWGRAESTANVHVVIKYVRVNVARILSFAVLSLCPISRNKPVQSEYSDVFIINPPFPTPDYSAGGWMVTLRLQAK